jgi:hypothetical protein
MASFSMLSLTFGRRDLVAASTFERARGAKVEWGNFSGSRNRRLMIMPGIGDRWRHR